MDLSLVSRTPDRGNWTYRYSLNCGVRRDVTLGQIDEMEAGLIAALSRAGLRAFAAPIILAHKHVVVLSLALIHGNDPEGSIRRNVERVIQSQLVPALEPLMAL